jgi:hypothetical protein
MPSISCHYCNTACLHSYSAARVSRFLVAFRLSDYHILIIGLCILLRVYQPVYVETSVRNKCRCSFYCALLTLHVPAPIGGHLQVVSNTKNSKAVTVYVNGSVASVRTKANAAVG